MYGSSNVTPTFVVTGFVILSKIQESENSQNMSRNVPLLCQTPTMAWTTHSGGEDLEELSQ